MSEIAEHHTSIIKRAVVFSLILLVATVAICCAMYFYRVPSLEGSALLRFGLAAIVGVGGIMLLLIRAASGPRTELAARVRELQETVQQVQNQKTLLQN